MMNKREILIGELSAIKFHKERKFDRDQTLRRVKRFARFIYLGLIGILGFIVYISFILEIPKIQIFNF